MVLMEVLIELREVLTEVDGAEGSGCLSCAVMIRVHPLNGPPGIQFNSH